MSTWTLAGLQGEALTAAGPPVTGLGLRVAVLQLLQSWGCGADLFSSALHNWGPIGKALLGPVPSDVPLPTVQGSGADARHSREAGTVQYSTGSSIL